MVVTKYAKGEIKHERGPALAAPYRGPLVILTSKASASAAEIVAETLKEEGVAVIVGDERTYGKGSLQYQTLTNPDARHFYKVTVGRYFTLSGHSPQMCGVEADIVVPTSYHSLAIGERYLRYPLAAESPSAKNEIEKIFKVKRIATQLQKRLPLLKANSEMRLAADRNFQTFLANQKEPSLGFKEKQSKCGMDDLQLREALNIVKDMSFMSM